MISAGLLFYPIRRRTELSRFNKNIPEELLILPRKNNYEFVRSALHDLLGKVRLKRFQTSKDGFVSETLSTGRIFQAKKRILSIFLHFVSLCMELISYICCGKILLKRKSHIVQRIVFKDQ